MTTFEVRASGVTVRTAHDVLHVDAWGNDTFRVRASPTGELRTFEEAIVIPSATSACVETDESRARIFNGDLTAVVEASGRVSFENGEGVVFAEPGFDPREPPLLPHRRYEPNGDGSYAASAIFDAVEGERIYGLGQHTLGRLNLTGCVVELLQRNTQVSVPVIVSSRGYGMLWNTPSVGRAEFALNRTQWLAAHAAQVDYFVYGGATPGDILNAYHRLTGFPASLPEWVTGYWQSKSYYRSQSELLAVAREHLARGLPLSAIFVDYMHWSHMGQWDWDAKLWPDPAAMVDELRGHGVNVVVSVWPHVSPHSRYFDELRERDLLVRADDGSSARFAYADRASPDGIDLALLDLTNPEARAFLWQHVKDSYYSIGIRGFWLDACEPEVAEAGPGLREGGLKFRLGDGLEVSGAFPYFDALALREGLESIRDTESVLIARSAWAGSQRLGVAVWSGDIQSTWKALEDQVTVGLNMTVSGLPWWTSDVGGFFDSDIRSDDFRELVVRWFQFAAFWPILRLHGNRDSDFYNSGLFSSGDANEVWSFGPDALAAISGLLRFRERIRPYLRAQMDAAVISGVPPVRPFWFAFTHDETAIGIQDQFVLGPDLLVAPVLQPQQTSRLVYLPTQSRWRDVWSSHEHEGGSWVEVDAPLHVVPLFERVGSALGIDRTWFA